jgi:hypothetical protein
MRSFPMFWGFGRSVRVCRPPIGWAACGKPGKMNTTADKHPPGFTGGDGTYTFNFLAVGEGQATLKLVYARGREKGKPAARTFTATIEVGKK